MTNIEINYDISKSVALRILKQGFGTNIGQILQNWSIAQRIGLSELTQLCAIARFTAYTDNIHFYKALQREIAQCGYSSRKQQLPSDELYEIEDFKTDMQVRQLRCAYHALGFAGFHKHLNKTTPKSTLQKWCWKAFGNRKDQPRMSKKDKKLILDLLKSGGRIRFSKTSSSVYFEDNETTIRVSDHTESEFNQNFLFKNIIISK